METDEFAAYVKAVMEEAVYDWLSVASRSDWPIRELIVRVMLSL